MLNIIRIPALKDNYIWLLHKNAAAIVVDPGEARPVRDALQREGLRLSAILITHHHHDHQGGVADLLKDAPVEVFGPELESITARTQPLRGGETICPADSGICLQVLAVPGHTAGHLAYFGEGCLFCGDTLFGAGCGRLFEGTAAQMAASLETISALPDSTQIYCAHEYAAQNLRFALVAEPGNPQVQARAAAVVAARARGEPTVPSTLALEKATNPFLRCTAPELLAAARQRGARSDDPVEVFATLRAWRDEF